MFSPSTAPRWKTATRIFLRRAPVPAAKTDLESHAGIEPVPKMARADPFRNARLDAIHSPSLKIRGTDHQSRHQAGSFLLLFRQGLLDAGPGLGRWHVPHQSLR